MKKIQHSLKIISNKQICGKYFHLVLQAKELAPRIKPGQFIHIKVNDGFEPLFRRPFSVYRAKAQKVEVLYEPVGHGTRTLSSRKTGEVVDVLGPLGQPFTLPGKDIKQVVFIAGGIGVAPFLLFSDVLKTCSVGNGFKPFPTILLYGARTRDQVFSMKEFKKNGVKTFIATEDGSIGAKGRVSELFSKVTIDPASTRIFTCGPKAMMAAVQKFAGDSGLKGEGSMEEVMACGLGACLGCSIKTTKGYRTVCHDGPVFALDELIF
jgi:dihydroorotate dehydrogenase electron transfer subunit